MAIITIITELNSSNNGIEGNIYLSLPLLSSSLSPFLSFAYSLFRTLHLVYDTSPFLFFFFFSFCFASFVAIRISLHDIRSQWSIVLHNWIQIYFLMNWPVVQINMYSMYVEKEIRTCNKSKTKDLKAVESRQLPKFCYRLQNMALNIWARTYDF